MQIKRNVIIISKLKSYLNLKTTLKYTSKINRVIETQIRSKIDNDEPFLLDYRTSKINGRLRIAKVIYII